MYQKKSTVQKENENGEMVSERKPSNSSIQKVRTIGVQRIIKIREMTQSPAPRHSVTRRRKQTQGSAIY